MQILFTKAEAAKAAKVSIRTVENWMKNGTLSYFKLGGIVRIPEDEMKQVLGRFLVRGRTARTKGSAPVQ